MGWYSTKHLGSYLKKLDSAYGKMYKKFAGPEHKHITGEFFTSLDVTRDEIRRFLQPLKDKKEVTLKLKKLRHNLREQSKKVRKVKSAYHKDLKNETLKYILSMEKDRKDELKAVICQLQNEIESLPSQTHRGKDLLEKQFKAFKVEIKLFEKRLAQAKEARKLPPIFYEKHWFVSKDRYLYKKVEKPLKKIKDPLSNF
jgi:hypothetical protein